MTKRGNYRAFILANTRLRPVPHVPEICASISPTSRCRCGRRPRRSWAPPDCRRPIGHSPGRAARRSRATCSTIRDAVREPAGARSRDRLRASSPSRRHGRARCRWWPPTSIRSPKRRVALNARGERRLCRRSSCRTCSTAPAPRGAALRRDPGRRPVLRARRPPSACSRSFERHAAHRHARADRRSRTAPICRRTGSTRLAEYSVPVTRELEDQDIKRTGVWRLR